MTQNIATIRTAERALRAARGGYVESLIKQDGRSARYVAINIGLNPTSMGERLKGRTPFLADELEAIARVLKIDPLEFYRGYIATADFTPKTPRSGVEDRRFAPIINIRTRLAA